MSEVPERFVKPTGQLNARIHGARNALREHSRLVRALSNLPDLDERFAASLRGKSTAYDEAERVLAALEEGTSLPLHRAHSLLEEDEL